jgi:hypothetical protein
MGTSVGIKRAMVNPQPLALSMCMTAPWSLDQMTTRPELDPVTMRVCSVRGSVYVHNAVMLPRAFSGTCAGSERYKSS